MEYATIAGNFYTITSKSGCSVTDATGTLNMTVDAGGQLTVQAPSDKLVYDDEQAIVFKANFNHALAALGLLGEGADKLPAGYTRLEFLKSTGTQYINTNYIPNDTTGLKGRYFRQDSRDTMEVGMRNSASSATRFYLPRFGRSVGGGFGWGDWYSGTWLPSNVVQSQLNWLNCRKAEAEFVGDTYKFTSELPTLPFKPTNTLFLFAANIAGSASLRCSCQMFELSISQGVEVKHIFIPALDPTGTPCMFDMATRKPYYNSGTGDFTYPNMEQRATTYSLRRREYAQMTERGIRRLYHVPRGYNGTPEEYAEQNGFKILVETPQPEEGYWAPVWHDREDCIELEWVETEPPAEELSNAE